jgi:chitosanase
MLTTTQAQTAKVIVNIFETSAVRGRYGMVTVIPGDTGHLTYGRSQTTLGSGNLHVLLKNYCGNSGARLGDHLRPYLPRFDALDLSLDTDTRVHNLLRAAADDVVMRDTQDAFFDEAYWAPAVRHADRTGISTPLGVGLVYDGIIQGSWATMRDRTHRDVGPLTDVGESAWVQGYVATRRHWLAHHSRADLRRTVYRMDVFQGLIDQGYWALDLPLVVRDNEISLASLQALPPDCFNGPAPGSRPLELTSPMTKGLDVRLLQLGLSDLGVAVKADGWYGQTTLRCIKDRQSALGLPATGVADVALIDKLVSNYV